MLERDNDGIMSERALGLRWRMWERDKAENAVEARCWD